MSVAFTFVPKRFGEFFNQRRRWGPSTIANVIDLLSSRRSTVAKNRSISTLYIMYQLLLFFSSVVGPATIILALETSMIEVFGFPTWLAYFLTLGPTAVFVIVCLKCDAALQLKLALILSTSYALLMMSVLVGSIISIARDGWFTPNAIFMYVLVGTFLVSGLLHPHELSDLLWGLLYYICIPAGYLFLILYSVCNLHVMSWGTRENKSANEQKQLWESASAVSESTTAAAHLQQAAKTLRQRIEEEERVRQQTATGRPV